ncbi:kinase-like protein [Ramaria rubella]|nr:kinase-like protein [Ramaria rubella]
MTFVLEPDPCATVPSKSTTVGVCTLLVPFTMNMYSRLRNKRKLMDSQEESLILALQRKRSRQTARANNVMSTQHQTLNRTNSDGVCARLVTTTKAGRKEAAVLSVGKPVTIGRNRSQCTYVISDSVVSNIHFKVYAIQSTSGAILLSCQDLSTNGIKLNDHLIKKSSIILMHGDVIKIPSSQTFKCLYTMPAIGPEKKTLFDATPPLVPVDKMVGKYKVTSYTLGSGTYATVNLAYTITESTAGAAYKQVACKMLKITNEIEKTKLMREVELLKGLNHPNINHVLDVVVKNGFLNIFLDLSTGGDLFTYISTRNLGRMKEGEARYCGYQLMLGLQYLHDRSVSHRDLKPENILLHTPGPFPRLIIADFGLARPRAHEHTLNAVGTICYMPPEAILALTAKNMGYVGIYADAWSLGMVLYAMLCGYNPFDWHDGDCSQHRSEVVSPNVSRSNRGDAIVMSRIVSSPVDFQDEVWETLSYARDLVGQLLIHNPKHRETVRGALSSRWILVELQDLKEGYRNRIGVSI